MTHRRHYSQRIQRSECKDKFSQILYEDLNTAASRSDKPKVFLVADPDKKLEVIPFLEDSLQNVEVLLRKIITNESRQK